MSTPLLEVVDKPNVAVPMSPDVAAFISVVDRASANPDFDADKLERLLSMYERIMDRNARMSFNRSFAEMQAKLPVITEHGKIEVNGAVRSDYARFEDINDVLKPILAEHGFGLMFKVRGARDSVSVTPILIHKDGHREEGEPMELGADTSGSKNSVQAMGSSTSYGKRYTVIPFLNITTRGEDDDGQAGGAKTITEDQVLELQKMITDYGVDQKAFLTYLKVSNLTLIPAAQYGDAKTALEKKRNAAKKGGK